MEFQQIRLPFPAKLHPGLRHFLPGPFFVFQTRLFQPFPCFFGAEDPFRLPPASKRNAVPEDFIILGQIDENADLPSLLQEMRRWADMLDRAGDDYTLKRNLILMTVKNVRCTDQDGHFELSVMTKGTKWRREGDSNSRMLAHRRFSRPLP